MSKTLEEYVEELEHGFLEQRAAAIAIKHGNKIGARNNQWVIDQMLRLISGEAYPTLIKMYEKKNGSGSWDTGLSPHQAA